MADQKVSDLPSLNGSAVDAADLLYIVDSSAGTAGSKKITVGQYQLAPYSAGTANGVMYLNGSNVVTTGSGLVFDGTNLGVGTSSPSEKLAINQGNIYAVRTGGAKVRLADQNNEVSVESLPVGGASNMVFKTSTTTQMTLDASGNLGIGTSSPAQRLDVRGAENGVHARFGSVSNRGLEISTQIVSGTTDAGCVLNARGASAGTLIFQTESTERARITSGGDLLVGTTTLAGAGGISLQSQSGTGFAVINNNNAGATGYVFQSFRRSSTEIGSITQNGTTAVLFNTTSDRRLKDNIVSAPSASDDIDAIQIVSYEWKAAPDEQVKYGVIAQDLHAVAPQAVLQGDDGDEIEKTWGVDYSKLVPMLIKEIQSLRARVAALEAA